jgi:hypothetical protein
MGLKVAAFLTNYAVPFVEKVAQACKNFADRIAIYHKGSVTKQVEA